LYRVPAAADVILNKREIKRMLAQVDTIIDRAIQGLETVRMLAKIDLEKMERKVIIRQGKPTPYKFDDEERES
jgi:hypothetical protein